jgi:hypothetical protein
MPSGRVAASSRPSAPSGARHLRGALEAWCTQLSAAALATCIAVPGAQARSADDPPPTPAAAPAAPARPGPLAPQGFTGVDEMPTRVRALAELAPGRSAIARIGVSRDGRPIEVVTFGEQDPSKKRPEVLVVAGMDAVNLASPEQAFAAAAHLVREQAAILDRIRLHVILCANPDARAEAFRTGMPCATNSRRIDHDRDGAIDEDAPEDFDGDGLQTWMRRPAPPGEAATHVVDPANGHIVRAADRGKGEIATHQVFPEGRDRDGDGVIGEDPATGVDLDRNFPHRWPEFDLDAGPYPLSEPESLAIARFVRDHPAILRAVVFGRHDTLAAFPDTKDKDSTGRTPAVYLAEDHDLYRTISKAWKETTKLEKSTGADLAGSLVLWLANHRGIAAVAANGWTRPEVPALAEGSSAPATVETGDAEQQAWIDLVHRMYDGRGLVAWKPATHPKYGAVEIGGFAPFLRESPTASQAEALAMQSAPFLAEISDDVPRLEASDLVVRDLGGGLARIGMRVTNRSDAPTTTEMGRITGVVPPVVVRIGVAPEDVVAGRAVEKLDRIAAHEAREFEWTVRMPSDRPLTVTVSGAFFDDIVRTADRAPGAPTSATPPSAQPASKEVQP